MRDRGERQGDRGLNLVIYYLVALTLIPHPYRSRTELHLFAERPHSERCHPGENEVSETKFKEFHRERTIGSCDGGINVSHNVLYLVIFS